MFVFKDGVPYLEITDGDFTKVKYRKNDKQLEVEAGTKIYHLDKTGIAMLWLIRQQEWHISKNAVKTER